MCSNPAESQRVISFCTGYGGLERGLELAGVDIQPLAYVEREAYAAANLASKIEKGKMAAAPIFSDVTTFPSKYFSEKVHGITGGYPCQPFSLAGRRRGGEDERHLWDYLREHIRTIRPFWCFFENVRGHLSLGFPQVLCELRELGYAVEVGLYSAAEVGAPHERCRLFILAHAHGFGFNRRDILRGEVQEGQLHNQTTVSSEGLANADSEQSSRVFDEFSDTQRRKKQRQHINICSISQWPRGQGEEQYEWESPREVQAQSRLGGATDGFADWVDRIRMVGNGVVPQTAALAWTELWKKARNNNG